MAWGDLRRDRAKTPRQSCEVAPRCRWHVLCPCSGCLVPVPTAQRREVVDMFLTRYRLAVPLLRDLPCACRNRRVGRGVVPQLADGAVPRLDLGFGGKARGLDGER